MLFTLRSGRGIAKNCTSELASGTIRTEARVFIKNKFIDGKLPPLHLAGVFAPAPDATARPIVRYSAMVKGA